MNREQWHTAIGPTPDGFRTFVAREVHRNMQQKPKRQARALWALVPATLVLLAAVVLARPAWLGMQNIPDETNLPLTQETVLSPELTPMPTEAVAPANEGAAVYRIGEDLQPGMYTFSPPAGREETLRVEGAGFTHELQLAGAGMFTVYLPEGATAYIASDVELRPIDENAWIISDTTSMRYTGSGRFLVGAQMPDGISLLWAAEGASEGRYAVIPKDYDRQGTEAPVFTTIVPGEQKEIVLELDEMLLFYDCLVQTNG